MKILIAGCGYVGTALGQRLALSGAAVWGLRRDAQALADLSSKGIQPINADLLDVGALRNLPSVDAVILCQGLSRSTDTYLKTYEEASANLVQVLKKTGVGKILMISSTGVYSTHDGSWVDESTDPAAAGYCSREAQEQAGCLLRTEKIILSAQPHSMVLRLAGIYGPGRNRIQALKEGRVRPSASETYSNRIHREDIVSAILLLLEKGKPGQIYLGADNYPSTQKEFYTWLCDKLSLKMSILEEPFAINGRKAVSNKRCSNEKIKKLGLVFKYPDFKTGYQELLQSPELLW